VAYFVILALTIDKKNWSAIELWHKIFDCNSVAIKFFKKSKILMNILLKERDWQRFKGALSVLLLIQGKYLHLLRSDKNKLALITERVRNYEFITNSFDLSNMDPFINLFYYLQMLAKRYLGKIPKSEPHKSQIQNLLRLFKFYKFHYNSYHWETLKVQTLDPTILSLILLDNIPREKIFDFLANPQVSPLYFNCSYSSNFKEIVETFFLKAICFDMVVDANSFQMNSYFYYLLEKSIKKNRNIFDLEPKNLWFIKSFLYIL
jgi:hypothetical protein